MAGEKNRVLAGDSSSHLKFEEEEEEEWHRENREVVVIFNGGTRITERQTDFF